MASKSEPPYAKIIILATVIIFAGCNSKSASSVPTDRRDYPVLVGEEIDVREIPLNPQVIFGLGNGYLIYDFDRENFYLYYQDFQANPERLVPYGSGPDEFTSIDLVRIDEANNFLTLFERDKKYLKDFSLADKKVHKTIKLEDRGSMTIAPLQNGYFSNGAFDEGIFMIMDKEGQPLKYFGKYPYGDGDGLNPNQKFMIYQNVIASHPSEDKIVAGGSLFDWLAIYDLTSGEPVVVKETYGDEPKVQLKGNGVSSFGIRQLPETFLGYKEIKTTDNHIYLICEGKTLQEAKEKQEQGTRDTYLEIYDWDGNLVKGFTLPENVYSIAVNKEGNEIIGLVFSDGDYKIKRYEITDL